MTPRRILLALAIAIGAAACADDGVTGPTPVAAVSISPTSLSLKVGESQVLNASLSDARGAPLAGRTVSWSSADQAIAQVSAAGTVTAIAPGQTTVAASSEGRIATATVTITPQPVAAIQLVASVSELPILQTSTFVARAVDSNGRVLADRTIDWSSSDTVVAAITRNGLLSSRRAGTTRVMALSEGQSTAVDLHVVPVSASYCGPQRSEWAAKRTTPALTWFHKYADETAWWEVVDTAAIPVILGKYVVVNGVSTTRADAPKVCGAVTTGDTSQVNATFSWSYTSPQTGGYFFVHVGVLDFAGRTIPGTTASAFPMRVDQVPEGMQVAFESEYVFPKDDVLLLDIFFYPTATSDWRYNKELMLVLNDVAGDDEWWRASPRRAIGGQTWAWAPGWGRQKPATYFPQDTSSFHWGKHVTLASPLQPSPARDTFALSLKPVFDALVDEGFLLPSDWMVKVQVGVEPRAGQGMLKLSNYRLTLR